MTCQELIEFLIDYVEGSLPVEQTERFEKHLAICPDCVAYLDSYRETIDLTKSAYGESDEDASLVAPADLIAAIVAAQNAGRNTK